MAKDPETPRGIVLFQPLPTISFSHLDTRNYEYGTIWAVSPVKYNVKRVESEVRETGDKFCDSEGNMFCDR